MGQRTPAPDQFAVARQRANQQATAAIQGQKEAMKRRFASMGNLNSGAAIAAEQQVEQKGQEQLAQVNESIDAAEQAENRRKQEIQEGREFQAGEAEKGRVFSRGEREASQGFAAEQAKIGRDFSREERISGQDFSRGERLDSERFAAGESKLTRDQQQLQFDKQFQLQNLTRQDNVEYQKQQLHLQNKQIDQQQAQFTKQLDQQREQFDKQYELDRTTTGFNKDLATREAESGILGAIFGY